MDVLEKVGEAIRAVNRLGAQPATGQEIFDNFDIVVAISQKTINDQLQKLVALGTIKSHLTLAQVAQGTKLSYLTPASAAEIPANAAYIDADVVPQIDIHASGTQLTFILAFKSGKAAFWLGGPGPLAQLTQFDVAGWRYGFTVTLDLTAVAAGDAAAGRATPDAVRQALEDFHSRMFEVSSLFLDFASSDLLRFDPARTTAGASNQAAPALSLFMEFYFKTVVAKKNPYVLGYSANPTDNSRLPDGMKNVPDVLRPAGTTFTLYHEPRNPDLSSLNFALVTKGGHRKIPGTPPNLSVNFLTAQRSEAAIVYSSTCLMQPMLIEPVFEQVRDTVYRGIAGHINVGPGNGYVAARRPAADGWSFTISDVSRGDDQYVNRFSVSIAGIAQSLDLRMSGTIHAYKEVSKNAFFCTARAWASGDIAWSGVVSLVAGDSGLKIARSDFKTDRNSTNHDTNKCADAFSWIGRILGGVLDVFTGFGDKFFFSKLVSNAFSVSVPGIGRVSVALSALSSAVQSSILLPAGDTFVYRNPPSSDPAGNLSIPLTYRH
jgi:hypothetical protein